MVLLYHVRTPSCVKISIRMMIIIIVKIIIIMQHVLHRTNDVFGEECKRNTCNACSIL